MNEPNWLTEQRRELVYRVALALYTVEYINKNQHQWETLDEHERMTDPAYIKGRFDAHQGIPRYDQIIKQAEEAVKIVIETAATIVETTADPFPHPACKPVPMEAPTGGFVFGGSSRVSAILMVW